MNWIGNPRPMRRRARRQPTRWPTLRIGARCLVLDRVEWFDRLALVPPLDHGFHIDTWQTESRPRSCRGQPTDPTECGAREGRLLSLARCGGWSARVRRRLVEQLAQSRQSVKTRRVENGANELGITHSPRRSNTTPSSPRSSGSYLEQELTSLAGCVDHKSTQSSLCNCTNSLARSCLLMSRLSLKSPLNTNEWEAFIFAYC